MENQSQKKATIKEVNKMLEGKIQQADKALESLNKQLTTKPSKWQTIKFYLTCWLPCSRYSKQKLLVQMQRLTYSVIQINKGLMQISKGVNNLQGMCQCKQKEDKPDGKDVMIQ